MNFRRFLRLLTTFCAGFTMFVLGGEEWHHPVIAPSLAQPAQPFLVFDGTLYQNKPDLSQFGVKPIRIIYEHEFYDAGQNRDLLPAKSRVQSVASSMKASGIPAVIDIERWPTSPSFHKISVAAAQESIQKYATVLGWFREAAPGLQFGLYGVVPIIDYWRAIEAPSSASYSTWIADNQRAVSLTKLVDALFPSLYTFYVDQEGWVTYAAAQLTEAKRLSGRKPVYVFLWPQYHDSNPTLGGTYLPAEYWKLELDTVRRYADGVVIWVGWGSGDKPALWDDHAGWWTVTKAFLATLPGDPPPAMPQGVQAR
jgi:hypothetical protein